MILESLATIRSTETSRMPAKHVNYCPRKSRTSHYNSSTFILAHHFKLIGRGIAINCSRQLTLVLKFLKTERSAKPHGIGENFKRRMRRSKTEKILTSGNESILIIIY